MSVSLRHPPIDEVVIGFGFDAVPFIDPTVAGLYWAGRLADFASHEIKEPIIEEGANEFDITSLRTWLISKDEATVLQLQRDRLYVNWRRRGDAEYPGFTKSIMGRAIDELRQFEAFCKTFGAPDLKLVTVELSKIDLLVQGRHWANPEELASVLPVLAPALHRLGMEFSGIAMRWTESYPNGAISVGIHPMQMRHSPETKAIRLETRLVTKRASAQLEEQLTNASEALNSIFGKIVVSEGG